MSVDLSADRQGYGGGRDDPWLFVLLGCAWLAGRLGPALEEGSGDAGPAAERDEALALDAALGALALADRFGALLARRLAPAGERTGETATPPGDWLR